MPYKVGMSGMLINLLPKNRVLTWETQLHHPQNLLNNVREESTAFIELFLSLMKIPTPSLSSMLLVDP